MHYETPYLTLCNKPEEAEYKPNWYWAYCATNYPPAFSNFASEAIKYYAANNPSSTTELENYERTFKTMNKEDFRLPYIYYFGEIYFTDNKTGEKYIMTMSYRLNKEYKDLDFAKIDTLKFKNRKPIAKGKKITDLSVNEILPHLPTTSEFYSFEDNIYKAGNPSYIYDNILRQGDHNLYFKGDALDQFYVMLRRAPNYIRSRIVNGKRIFETVKQTPKGIVVVGKKRNKLEEN